MKKISLILLSTALLLTALYVVLQEAKNKKNFYQITCGSGDNEVQYIATKKDGNKYLVAGEMKEFKDCKAELVEIR